MAYPVIATKDDEAFFAQPHWKDVAPAIRRRVIIERAIVRKACRDILKAGYALRVHNGEHWACGQTTDLAVVMSCLNQTEEDCIHVYERGSHTYMPDRGQGRIGWIAAVYGNDGPDVIANNTVNLDDLGLLKGASELADKFAEAA